MYLNLFSFTIFSLALLQPATFSCVPASALRTVSSATSFRQLRQWHVFLESAKASADVHAETRFVSENTAFIPNNVFVILSFKDFHNWKVLKIILAATENSSFLSVKEVYKTRC
ncbi:hypothetical protein G6F37_003916 [Rhizopus arrhizus]|nr:hypothetical protein G6F38_004085 [Rhizopus arrhizus]KAG1160517.1 hypothetical protein G6F37_003916 [Rhizopus arrhizus]